MTKPEAFSLAVDFLKDLIALETVNPPGNEQIAAAYVARRLAEYGIAADVVEIAPGRANVVSRRTPGQGPVVLLTGHLDVVPVSNDWQTAPFAGIEKEGKIFGRGACDMKGGMAAMMAAAVWSTVQEKKTRPFQLAFVFDEEIYGEGTRAFLKGFQEECFAVIGEPTENQIHIAHRGAIRFRIRVRGRSCHAGSPESGINAIENMARVVEAVRRVNEKLKQRKHPILPPPTLCATMIQAGTKDNIVPDLCELVVDGRPGVGDTVESLQNAIRAEIEAGGGLQDGAEVTFEPYINVVAGSVNMDSAIVQWAGDCYRRCFQQDPVVTCFPACCDLSQFTAAGHQAILYGPGSIAQAHTTNEFVTLEQLEKAFAFYCCCLQRV